MISVGLNEIGPTDRDLYLIHKYKLINLIGALMVIGTNIQPELRIAMANFRFSGIVNTSSERWDRMMRWEKTVAALRSWHPHIVLCQALSAIAPGGLRAHLWGTANTLEMIPLLGPPSPYSVTGDHPAILVSATTGLVILDSDPVLRASACPQPAWCEALVQVPGWARPMRVYNVDLSSHSSVEQRSQADRLATRIVELGELAIAGGNWNSYSRTDVSTHDIPDSTSLALAPTQLRYNRRDGVPTPSYEVHDVLASIGMEDTVAVLRSKKANLEDPVRAGTSLRTDRIYMTREIAGATARCVSHDMEDSSHPAQMLVLDGPAAANAFPG